MFSNTIYGHSQNYKLGIRMVKGHSRCSFKPLTQPFWRFTKIINRQSTPEGQSPIRQAACNVAFYFSFIDMCNSSNWLSST